MSPLERAARALIDADPTINGYHQVHIDYMMPRVRAVIAAIREPSEAMVAAGESKTDTYYSEEDDFGCGWCAAIDALLEERR